MIRLANAFAKITGWPVQKVCFRTKIYYENKKVQSRKIKGPAIIVSNHTSVFDYAVFMFVFFSRTLRYQMAEVLFKRRNLSKFLKNLGGIEVDRDAHNFNFINKSEDVIKKGGIVGVFPESRLAGPNEEKPLEFKPSVTYIALSTGAPIIPVYTNGSYFQKKRARVIIGKPIYVSEWAEISKTEKENIDGITRRLREEIISLGKLLDEKQK